MRALQLTSCQGRIGLKAHLTTHRGLDFTLIVSHSESVSVTQLLHSKRIAYPGH